MVQVSNWEKFRDGHCRHARSRFSDSQNSCIQTAKLSDKSSADLKGFRFADSQESRYQLLNVKNMFCRKVSVSIWNSQESRFQAAERSYIGSAILQGRFATAKYLHFLAAKHAYTVVMHGFLLADV